MYRLQHSKHANIITLNVPRFLDRIDPIASHSYDVVGASMPRPGFQRGAHDPERTLKRCSVSQATSSGLQQL